MKFVDTFDKHRNNPDVSLGEYTKKKRHQLCEEISSRKKIYLDTKYWIYIRDVELGRSNDKILSEILGELRNLVKNKIAICPISDEIFYELLLQTDPTTLNQTVKLIDEFSQGVAILSSEERVMYEILYFFNSFYVGNEQMQPQEETVWSKVSYIYGLTHPTNEIWGAEELVIQKAFFDQMWSLSLADVTNTMGMENIIKWPRHNDITEKLTKEKVQHSHENKSFKELYLSELAGVLDVYRDLILEGFEYFYMQKTGNKVSHEERQSSEGRKVVNVIYNLFKLEKLGTFFPSFIVESGLHASVRNDLPRKYKKNDLSDFRHAKTALPYFDAFFTERSLKNMVCTNNVSLDKKYNCEVFYKPLEVQKYIKKLTNGSTRTR